MVRVLIFKYGRPLGTTESAKKAMEITQSDVYQLLNTGRQTRNGFAFDYPLDGIEYRMLQSKQEIQ